MVLQLDPQQTSPSLTLNFLSSTGNHQTAWPPHQRLSLLGGFPVVTGPSGHANNTLLIFKRMGQAKSLAVFLLCWVSPGCIPIGVSSCVLLCPLRPRDLSRLLELGGGIPLSSLSCPQGQGPQQLCLILPGSSGRSVLRLRQPRGQSPLHLCVGESQVVTSSWSLFPKFPQDAPE